MSPPGYYQGKALVLGLLPTLSSSAAPLGAAAGLSSPGENGASFGSLNGRHRQSRSGPAARWARRCAAPRARDPAAGAPRPPVPRGATVSRARPAAGGALPRARAADVGAARPGNPLVSLGAAVFSPAGPRRPRARPARPGCAPPRLRRAGRAPPPALRRLDVFVVISRGARAQAFGLTP